MPAGAAGGYGLTSLLHYAAATDTASGLAASTGYAGLGTGHSFTNAGAGTASYVAVGGCCRMSAGNDAFRVVRGSAGIPITAFQGGGAPVYDSALA